MPWVKDSVYTETGGRWRALAQVLVRGSAWWWELGDVFFSLHLFFFSKMESKSSS